MVHVLLSQFVLFPIKCPGRPSRKSWYVFLLCVTGNGEARLKFRVGVGQNSRLLPGGRSLEKKVFTSRSLKTVLCGNKLLFELLPPHWRIPVNKSLV